MVTTKWLRPNTFSHSLRRVAVFAPFARRQADNLVNKAAERLRRLQQQLKHAPSLGLLERSIGRAVDRLMPREIAQLRRVLTAPRAALAFKARELVKDIVLGRGADDEDE